MILPVFSLREQCDTLVNEFDPLFGFSMKNQRKLYQMVNVNGVELTHSGIFVIIQSMANKLEITPPLSEEGPVRFLHKPRTFNWSFSLIRQIGSKVESGRSTKRG